MRTGITRLHLPNIAYQLCVNKSTKHSIQVLILQLISPTFLIRSSSTWSTHFNKFSNVPAIRSENILPISIKKVQGQDKENNWTGKLRTKQTGLLCSISLNSRLNYTVLEWCLLQTRNYLKSTAYRWVQNYRVNKKHKRLTPFKI